LAERDFAPPGIPVERLIRKKLETAKAEREKTAFPSAHGSDHQRAAGCFFSQGIFRCFLTDTLLSQAEYRREGVAKIPKILTPITPEILGSRARRKKYS
jgi:hypothetical protein